MSELASLVVFITFSWLEKVYLQAINVPKKYCLSSKNAIRWGDGVAGWRGLFVAEAFLHEGLAVIAFLAGGVRVTFFHLVLLGQFRFRRGGWFGAQAFLHEGLAFIAFFAGGVRITGFHLALLRRRLGGERGAAQRQAEWKEQAGNEQFFHVNSSRGLKMVGTAGCLPRDHYN